MHEDSPDRKIPIVMETSFSEGKLMKQFGTPLFLTETPPLSTNSLFMSNFFMTPLFIQISKTTSHPNFRGRGNYDNPQINSSLKR